MTHNGNSVRHRSNWHPAGGFTLIELMIVIAVIAIILALALPVYSNYTIRAKIAEGLSVENMAVTAVSATCIENPAMTSLSNQKAGFSFEQAALDTAYVEDIQVEGACTNPLITISSKNTGQSPAPIILMNGQFAANSGQITWNCSSDNTPDHLLPNICRS